MKYKTVFIDWNGTLCNSQFWERWETDELKREQHTLVRHALFENEAGVKVLNHWMRGWMSVSSVVQYLHDTTGIGLNEIYDELLYSAHNMHFINDDVIKKIQTLRHKGIHVAIASDNMDIFRAHTVKTLRLEDLFDAILTSDSQSALKREINESGASPFFDDYLLKYGIRSGESVLIDDSESSRSVEAIGIDFLHVNEAAPLEGHLNAILGSS